MRTLTATELLGAWERGSSQSSAFRALILLSLADSDTPPEELARLPIGWRDAQLFQLRESAFGSRINGSVVCPGCNLQLELNFTVADVQAALPERMQTAFALSMNDHEVSFRLPNTNDLTELPVDGDGAILKRALLQRCVLEAKRGGVPISFDQVPADVAQAVSERMAEADPQGDLQLMLTCPQCAHCWRESLDIVSFLWSEIHAWSVRLLREAHVLASTYGWREADILAMTPWRRQFYLDMIGP